ncbi:MAG TPA: heme ABC exporter ATP-binding protein CcmA [Stellaceae bacterium]
MSLFAGQGLVCVRGERMVFAGLGFAVPSGGALLLTGPNGSGKSSLLRVLAGLLPPAAGSLAWDGEPIAKDRAAHRARLHFVGHQDALKPLLTVTETLAFWSGLRTDTPKLDAALSRFRLAPLAATQCRLLSAGQRHRLSLARLVASPAALWLLDEPTTGLDRDAVADLEAAIAGHRADGGIAIVSTHTPIALPGAEELDMAAFAPRQTMAAEAFSDEWV